MCSTSSQAGGRSEPNSDRSVAVQWLGVMPPLGFQKSLKPRNTLYTLPSEPQPDRKRGEGRRTERRCRQ